MMPSMNRRDFLRRASLLTASGWLVPSSFGRSASAVPEAQPLGAFHPLRRHTGYFTGRGGTIGWLVAADALVVVDTQFPDTAEFCLAQLPGRGGRTLDAVINTHHHRDHTSGNGVFRSAARTIVAQANVPALQMAAAERAGATAAQVVANETFADHWRQEMGNEVVSARYFGAAHTKGDVVVYFERANIVHMGDLVFNRLYPVIDRLGGAKVRHWITVLEETARTYPRDAIYLYGHGSAKYGVTGGHGDLLVFRDYLSGLLDHVEKAVAAGKSRDEILQLGNLPGFDDFHTPPPNRLTSNLAVAYEELTVDRA